MSGSRWSIMEQMKRKKSKDRTQISNSHSDCTSSSRSSTPSSLAEEVSKIDLDDSLAQMSRQEKDVKQALEDTTTYQRLSTDGNRNMVLSTDENPDVVSSNVNHETPVLNPFQQFFCNQVSSEQILFIIK